MTYYHLWVVEYPIKPLTLIGMRVLYCNPKEDETMDSIVEGLMKQIISGDNLSLMSKSVGADDKSVQSALGMGLPLLLGAMNNNASKPEGAQAIMNSLSQMGNNNPMDSLSGYLSAPGSTQGSSMLTSIMGSSLSPIEQAVSKSTGLPPAVVSKVLAMALPLVLGSLSKSSPGKSLGPNDLSKLLGDQTKMAMAASPDATGVMNELLASQKSSGGLTGLLKKFIK
jgi:hypothetical protein